MAKRSIKRSYKDSLFRLVFREKKELLSLYNAVNASSYDDPEELEVTTLEDAIYVRWKNDISFLIKDVMSLYEHQSSVNPNMPLRGLLYLSSLYEAYIDKNELDIYAGRLIKLPMPQYIIFYNGRADEPERREFKLTDSFNIPDGRTACLECIAVQYNINSGSNTELMKSCEKLAEYSEFVMLVRKFQKELGSLEDAIDAAVDYCIEHGILADILRKHRAEVRDMLLYEYDEELHMKTIRQEGVEEGIEQGIRKGIEQGIKEGIEQGIKEGIEQGKEQGMREGFRESEECMEALAQKLLEDNRQDDLIKAVLDKEYRNKLYLEYEIIKPKRCLD